MTISSERRMRLLEEMHEMGDSRVVTDDPNRPESFTSPLTYGELRALLLDSAEKERYERQVRELADKYDFIAEEGYRVHVGITASRLRAIVDTGRGEGGEV